MWYVYFLRLSNGEIYVGSTNDLRRRIKSHQDGPVLSMKIPSAHNNSGFGWQADSLPINISRSSVGAQGDVGSNPTPSVYQAIDQDSVNSSLPSASVLQDLWFQQTRACVEPLLASPEESGEGRILS